jgi:murein DD-endopeptidase MepM/ murein hydrolase activator NlpD
MAEYSSLFQFNNQILDIPPKNIRVDRQSFNNQWQTLRTQSSIKSKSGFSTADIYITVEFIDELVSGAPLGSTRNGFRQLRDLISQFRVTPFCYVENSFLRDKFFAGHSHQSMALALKQMEITAGTDDRSTNVIVVNFHFCWFNYFPFMRDFLYKKNLMGTEAVKNPADSKPWQLMYQAEQRRHKYKQVDRLHTGLVLSFKEYKALTVKRYFEVRDKEVASLKKLSNELSQLSSNKEGSAVGEKIRDVLFDELKDENWARSLRREIFGDTTSMFYEQNSKNVLHKVKSLIKEAIEPGKRDSRFAVEAFGWKPVILRNGEYVTIKSKPSSKPREADLSQYNPEDTILLSRDRELDFNDIGLIVQGISISFENILATLPLVGHPYPTFQHIGSIDARVSFSIATVDQKAIRHLSEFYSLVEGQHHKYRNIPSGHKNISVDNDLVNMCGLSEFLPENLSVENVEGEPGTWSAIFTLIDNPLTTQTQEKLIPGQSFTSAQDLRIEIAHILEKNLKFNGDKFLHLEKDTFWKETTSYKTFIDSPYSANIERPLSFAPTIDNPRTPYYIFNGPLGQKSQAFKELCSQYAEKFSYICEYLLFHIRFLKYGNVGIEMVSDLSVLTDEDVFGIERINEDLSKVYDVLTGKNGSVKLRDTLSLLPRQTIYGGDVKATTDAEIKQNAENLIKAENERNERAALSSIGFGETIPNVAGDFFDKYKTENIKKLQGFINKIFGDWINFANDFLDRILNDDDILSLPQFQTVRDLIRNNRGGIDTADCFPDFPLREVLSLIQEDTDLSTFLYDGLVAFWEKAGLGLKNVGISSLINPDFYFLNHTVDVIDDIFPHHIIEKTKDSIIAARASMKEAESDWFKNVYETEILGSQRRSNVFDTVVDSFKTDFFKGDNSPGKNYADEYQKHLNEYGTAPNLLTGSVAPSVFEANKNGESVPVKGISFSKSIIKSRQSKYDTQCVISNHRSPTTMRPSSNSESVSHRFDTYDCLSFLPEQSYSPVVFDKNKTPVFIPPTPSTARRITSPFGKRLDPVRARRGVNKEVFHTGIDIAGNIPADSAGTPIYAAETGRIIGVNNDERGVRVRIKHGNGYETRYGHLKWEPIVQGFFDIFFDELLDSPVPKSVKDRVLIVRKGQQIGVMDNTGYSTGSHLHFEIRQNGVPVDPIAEEHFSTHKIGKIEHIVGVGEYKSQGPLLGIDPENESLFYKSVQQFEKDLKTGAGYGMMRAYPAFKLYFIESDLGERKKYAFDDFFAYNAVQEIQVVRHRKIAADLCILQLTNISGSLNNRKFIDAKNPNLAFREDGSISEEREGDSGSVNTIKENPIASLMLQAGTQIQLKMGFSNNPAELETVFNGMIVEYQFSETTDLVTIVCQSFAVELVQTIQGESKSFGGWFSDDGRTWMVLNNILSAPEVVHFGRWEAGGFGANKQRGLLQSRWRFNPNPRDDNLFPPQGSGPLGFVDALINPLKAAKGSKKYIMFNTTIWDVLQEMTLRHPSYITSAVPYESKYGPRMTLFFGLPDQLYFARDSTVEEDNVISKLREVVKNGITDDYTEKVRTNLQDASRELGKEGARDLDNALKKIENSQSDDEIENWLKKAAKLFAQARGFIKPFRSYHIATSSLHILHNSISSSGHNVFNTVTLQYSDDGPEFNKDTSELNFGDPETFTLKADAAIPDEDIREMFAQYPNCNGYEMAKLYSLSLLYNSLKESYGGSLILVGNPKIKPLDVIYIFDEYSDIYGPVEVEKVVHKFSQKNGFITEITPDLCVHVNQESTLSTQDAMGLIAEHGLRQIGLESLGSIHKNYGDILSAAFNPISGFGFSPLARMFFNQTENTPAYNQQTSLFGSVGLFIFRKLVTRTQLAHPFRFSPLVCAGKPMIGGLPNRYTDGSFIQGIGDWFKETSETIPLYLEDTYDKFKNNYWFGHSEGDFSSVFLGDDLE